MESDAAAVLDLKGAQTINVSKVFSKEIKKRFLAYKVDDTIYTALEYSYKMSILVRVYKGYLFSNYKNYEELGQETVENDITVLYSIKEQSAQIKFKVNKNEYFITLNGHGATVINEESVESFIRSIL